MSDNKYKIILPDVKNVTFGDLDLRVFEKYGEVITYPTSKTEDLQERLKDADIILCNKTLLNRTTLKYADRLKYIGLFATGYNNVDLDYTNEKGIVVSNAGSYSTDSVAQHTFALILNYFNKIAAYSQFTAEGEWKKSETFSPFIYKMGELSGKTIGIVGFGSIGRRVAEIARVFGMKVLIYSRNREKAEKAVKEMFGDAVILKGDIMTASLDELVSKSDVVTLHCPLNKDSEKMINRELLSRFKKEAYLVNTARGGLVDEDALREALNQDMIAGAALDVLNDEPMAEDCKLIGAKNITITPHIAWASFETRARLLSIVLDNLEGFMSGSPKNVVK